MRNTFEPIAIVGQGCVLPGAASPAELWDLILGGENILGEPPTSYWGVDADAVSTTPEKPSGDHTWSLQGGYVRGFEDRFDPEGFMVDAKLIRGLDPLFQWTLDAARQAWVDAGYKVGEREDRAGVILGNLSYPTRKLSDFAEQVWRGEELDVDAHNRYMSGLPAHLISAALGADGPSFSLDAACASSLYAIKLACDRLHDGSADVMLAGGVNHADDLFLHIGFCALNALSKTGQSRPFNRGADGLIPAEGAGFVVLKRLEDALAAGDEIHGLIRGVGLSNDGRGRGMLTPSEDGQWRAMQNAYEVSGLGPKDISLVECHATGTPLGDATELRSMARVFEGFKDIPIGSFKSNLGHLITASGVAGLLKVLSAMRHKMRPPTLHVDEPIEWLEETPFRVLEAAERWECEGPRRAAVNNFGFGGNNAHLLVEEWISSEQLAPRDSKQDTDAQIAIVGVSTIVGEANHAEAMKDALLGGLSGAPVTSIDEVTFDIKQLRFPPNDLKHTLPQQLLTMETALQISEQIDALPAQRTGIYMGMQCDTEIARYGARWRMANEAKAGELASQRDTVVPTLVSAGVVGTMPNIVANRLNSQFNLSGPSFTVSSEQASGLVAVELAARALRHKEIDAALVGAADLCDDPVHEAAARAILAPRFHKGGDASVLLVLKRLDDARADGDTIYAILDQDVDASSVELGTTGEALDLTSRFGHAHAASGLLHLGVAALLCHQRARLTSATSPAQPWLPTGGERRAAVSTEALMAPRLTVGVRAGESTGRHLAEATQLYVFGATSLDGLRAALAKRAFGEAGAWRVAIVCAPDELDNKLKAALAALSTPPTTATAELTDGVYFGQGDLEGDVALVFTGPAGAYKGMGRDLLLAMPELVDAVADQFANLDDAVGWLYADGEHDARPVDKLWGSSFLSQVHARLTLDHLGIKPAAAIGYCSGETNAAFALGAWRGLDTMHGDIEELGVFDRALGGQFEVLRQAWGLSADADVDWQTWRLLAKREDVEAALRGEERVYLTIVNSATDVVIAGQSEACDRVIASVGAHRAKQLGYNIVMHCPEARPYTATWHDLHHRPSADVGGVRFYTHATLSSYEPTSDTIADALTGQAMGTVDFPALIERAWDDGVRVFIEHGPHAGCTKWIQQTLGDKAHLACALDEFHATSVATITTTIARLIAAGVDFDWSAWCARARHEASATEPKKTLRMSFPAHMPEVKLSARARAPRQVQTPSKPAPETQKKASGMTHKKSEKNGTHHHAGRVQFMAPAPTLPSVLADTSALHAQTPTVQPRQIATPTIVAPASASVPAPTPAVAPVVAPTAAPMPAAPVAAAAPVVYAAQTGDIFQDAIAAQFEQLAAIHREFIDRQTTMQQQFLVAQNQLVQEFVSRARGVTVAPVAQPIVAQPVAPAPVVAAPVAPAPVVRPTAPKPVAKPVVETTPAPKPVVSKPVIVKPPVKTPPKVVKPAPKPEVLEPAKPVAKPAPASKTITRAEAQRQTLQKHQIIPSNQKPQPVGPTFDYDQIAIHASGKISEVFGPQFAIQDDWEVQVRMPEPPLLLCHRVTGIDCERGVVGKGTLWCESDIPEDAWFLHAGRMPVGIMIESGQADLMLISWMGADFENKGDRVYRLLGCELMFHGGLAQPGDVLAYDIHIDGHARQNDIRLFFFHYDLEINNQVRLSVRNGQAGFFSYDELDDSNGILWKPTDEDIDEINATPFAPHPCVTSKRSFSAEEVQAFAEGRVYDVFGPGFEYAAPHTATPTIQADKMRFMDEVLEFDPTGGPWKRGYLKAIQHISPDDWFFDGHFKNDPCMPGTLMFEGCVQVMAFYMAACGWTITRDGGVFEPIAEEIYKLVCRGQVDPESTELIYEVFVREVHDGPIPMLYADLLCTVDGLGAFHCARMGLQITPAWPMDRQPELLADYTEPKPVATSIDGHEFGYDSLLACAWGRPTRAFGPVYEPFDSHRKVARLPGPPYHFISRVTEVDPEAQNSMRSDVDLWVEYDVPADAWYFEENGAAVMPYAVLLEAALQPCGWLASYVGCALTRDDVDLAFRNLDGTTTQYVEVTPETGTLRTHTFLKTIARAGGNIIVAFDVEMRAIDQDDALVLKMDTVFGFFPPAALASQVGLPVNDDLRAWFDAPVEHIVDLTTRPERYCNDTGASLAEPMLLMIDRVTSWEADGGEAGLGRARAVKDVDPREWFFKAHFYQDPVQPGSLGLEALLQLLQFMMLHKDLDEGIENPRFEAIAIDKDMSWKYRGQVLPHNKLITSTVELTEVGRDERGVYALATGSLWVDGMRIYTGTTFGMRIVSEGNGPVNRARAIEDPADPEPDPAGSTGEPDDFNASPVASLEREWMLDASGRDAWLMDHCPTHTRAALPMMSMVDLFVLHANEAYPEHVVSSVAGMTAQRWVIFDDVRKLRTRLTPTDVPGVFDAVLEVFWRAPRVEMSRFDKVASAKLTLTRTWAQAPTTQLAALEGAVEVDPYASQELFHGPAFQVIASMMRGSNGARATLETGRSGVPAGAVLPALLDGALQPIPHGSIELWWPEQSGDSIAYPHTLESMRFHAATPAVDELTSEVRFVRGEGSFVTSELRVYAGEELWVSATLTEVLMPKGPIGALAPIERRAFIDGSRPVEGGALSVVERPGEVSLDLETVAGSNWFKGTLEAIYGVAGSVDELCKQIAVKDAVASKLGIHPSRVRLELDQARAWVFDDPLVSYIIELEAVEGGAKARVVGEPARDHLLIKRWWQNRLGVPNGWFGDDVYGGLIERFVERVDLVDPDALLALRGKPVFFLGNHEVQIESLLITILGSYLTDTNVVTMANAKHEHGWVGHLIRDLFAYPGCEDPHNIVYFNQADHKSMFTLLDKLKQDVLERGVSLMVHAPGTRATRAGEQVERVSSALIDLALDLEIPIVPVYFAGGLPNEAITDGKLEFPVDQTAQVYRIGAPLPASALRAMPYGERRQAVLGAINSLTPAAPTPGASQPELVAEVAEIATQLDSDEINSTLLSILMNQEDPGHDTRQILGSQLGDHELSARTPEHRKWLEAMIERFFGAS